MSSASPCAQAIAAHETIRTTTKYIFRLKFRPRQSNFVPPFRTVILRIGAAFASLFREICGEASIPNGLAGVNIFQQGQEIFLTICEVVGASLEIFLTQSDSTAIMDLRNLRAQGLSRHRDIVQKSDKRENQSTQFQGCRTRRRGQLRDRFTRGYKQRPGQPGNPTAGHGGGAKARR